MPSPALSYPAPCLPLPQKHPETHVFEGSGILTPPTSRVASGPDPDTLPPGSFPPFSGQQLREIPRYRDGEGPENKQTVRNYVRRNSETAGRSSGKRMSAVGNPNLIPSAPGFFFPSPSTSDGTDQWGRPMPDLSPVSYARHALGKQNVSGPLILAPASPAGRGAGLLAAGAEDRGGEVVFLIGGYARYQTPFVWLRSGVLEGHEEQDRDVPLELKSTEKWSTTKRASVWGIVAELVRLTVKYLPLSSPLS